MNPNPNPVARPRVLMLGTALGGRGGVATVVSLLQQDGLFEREAVRYLATHIEGSRATKARAALCGLWRTVCICLCQRPAVVHAHAASNASFVRKSLLLLVARAAGCQTVFHLHGARFDQFAQRDAGFLMRRWIRHTLRASSVVIALSERWAAFLRGYAPGARVVVVPNSVPLPAAPAASAEQAGRILFLGQVDGRKGIYDLLAAVAALLPGFPQIELAIGGQGELDQVRQRAAELGIADHLVLLGWVDARQKQTELARAAVFCLPSHAEGLPMAMLEAMAAGKAVVVSDVGGIPDAVQDGSNGLLVQPGQVPQLAAALGAVLGDQALRSRLGQQARATIAARFKSDVVIGQIAAIYRELSAVGAR
jgi:glycosyltransferase involved in cell wall biosynthesis